MCELLYQLTEIHSPVGGKVEDDTLATEYVFCFDYFHWQVQFFDEPSAVFRLFFCDFFKVPFLAYIVGGCEADESADRVNRKVDTAAVEVFLEPVAA